VRCVFREMQDDNEDSEASVRHALARVRRVLGETTNRRQLVFSRDAPAGVDWQLLIKNGRKTPGLPFPRGNMRLTGVVFPVRERANGSATGEWAFALHLEDFAHVIQQKARNTCPSGQIFHGMLNSIRHINILMGVDNQVCPLLAGAVHSNAVFKTDFVWLPTLVTFPKHDANAGATRITVYFTAEHIETLLLDFIRVFVNGSWEPAREPERIVEP
jgi:hypothetical protein